LSCSKLIQYTPSYPSSLIYFLILSSNLQQGHTGGFQASYNVTLQLKEIIEISPHFVAVRRYKEYVNQFRILKVSISFHIITGRQSSIASIAAPSTQARGTAEGRGTRSESHIFISVSQERIFRYQDEGCRLYAVA